MTSEHDSPTAWNDRSMREMVTHLEHEHHQIVRGIIFHSAMLLNEAACADEAAATAAMRHAFRKVSDRLILHIEKEEHLFFPTLLLLDLARQDGDASSVAPRDVRRNVQRYMQEHAEISDDLAELHQESARVELGGTAIAARLRKSLEALERHVHDYLDFENCIVFPRAVALEADLQPAPPALSAARH